MPNHFFSLSTQAFLFLSLSPLLSFHFHIQYLTFSVQTVAASPAWFTAHILSFLLPNQSSISPRFPNLTPWTFFVHAQTNPLLLSLAVKLSSTIMVSFFFVSLPQSLSFAHSPLHWVSLLLYLGNTHPPLINIDTNTYH